MRRKSRADDSNWRRFSLSLSLSLSFSPTDLIGNFLHEYKENDYFLDDLSFLRKTHETNELPDTVNLSDDVTMSTGILHHAPSVIRTVNVSRMSNETIATAVAAGAATNTLSLVVQATLATTSSTPLKITDISPIACFSFVMLILATVGGNTLVLLAICLDKRLHSPSFFLIANMAVADLLLGKRDLPLLRRRLHALCSL